MIKKRLVEAVIWLSDSKNFIQFLVLILVLAMFFQAGNLWLLPRFIKQPVHHPELRDISLNELRWFLLLDDTDQHQYIGDDVFDCYDFAVELQHAAHECGIRCAFVTVYYDEPPHHAINAFNTTDFGMIYIEPQDDSMVVPDRVIQVHWELMD